MIRCFQSGSTESPKTARGLVFVGRSSAGASIAPNAPAARPLRVCRNCLRRKLCESGRIIVFAFLEDRTCVGFITKTVGRWQAATPSIFSNACRAKTEFIELLDRGWFSIEHYSSPERPTALLTQT